MDPSALISPVTDALGTLGSGLFDGMDPTAMLGAISQVFDSSGGSLAQPLGSLSDSWQGTSSTAAATKTAAAIANGSEVGAQSDALRASMATAATDVAQARVRLIEIITEFQATMAAIGPNIIFPWGWAAAIAAANKAIAMTTTAMTELQSSLSGQAAQVTTAGLPVNVTAAPQAGGSPLAGLVSSLMAMATTGAQAGLQAGTEAAAAESRSASQAEDSATAPVEGTPVGAASPVGTGAGGGSSGGAGTLASRSMTTSPTAQLQPATAPPAATFRAPGATGLAGGSMMGGPFAPMAGHGANASSNNHTSAAFLHTSDQGTEIVGDLGTAAPPVLGEADPNEPPDVELRI